MHDEYLPSRGIAYRVSHFDDTKETLVFVHGLSGSLSAWYPYEPHLVRDFNVVTFDLRGHGFSKRYETQNAYRVHEFSDDLVALVEHLKLERFTLVAHSFGSFVVREYLREHSHHVSRVLLLAPTFRIQQLWRSREMLAFCELVAPILRVLPVLPLKKRIDYAPFRGGADFDLGRIVADIRATGLHSYLWGLIELYKDREVRWPELHACPTFILHGDKDGFVPFQNSILLKSSLINCELTVLPGATHMLVNNYMAEVIDFIFISMKKPGAHHLGVAPGLMSLPNLIASSR